MWRKNTWCLAIITGIFCVMLNSASAEVRINEVMPNPEDNCSDCTEWIEIYASSPTNLTNWIINATNQKSNFSFYLEDFLIITKDKTNFLNYWSINSNKVIEWSGMSLLNSGEDIFLFNYSSAPISSINYPDFQSYANKSYSLLPNSSWAICSSPTPGSVNSCSSPQPQCFQNWSCSAWGSCTNGEQTRSCIDLNNCYNSTGKPSEDQSCITNTSIYLELDYASEVKNGEFEITAKLYNLELKDYDIKVYVTFEENDTVISETYNENEWKSSTYYINNIVSGTGNKTLNVKLRIDDKYSKFKGNAKLNARLRESASSNTVANFEDNIKILEKENSSSQSSNQGTITLNLLSNSSNNSNGGIGLTSNVIKLNSPSSASTNTTKDIKSNIVYKSKVEYFKEYGFYALGIVCIVIIFVLLRK